MNFSEAIQHFGHTLEAGRLAHGYIISSPHSEGVRWVEQALGLLFCRETDKPCGECPMCRQTLAHQHPDVLWVEPENKSRTIGIDQIREVMKQMSKSAYCGGWKGAVLLGADRLNAEAANAFLKTLEEPPPKTIFFLIAENPQFMLPTILSRCQTIRLSAEAGGPVEKSEWLELLLPILGEAGADEPEGPRVAVSLARAAKVKALMEGAKAAAGELEAQNEKDEDSKDTMDARVASRYRRLRDELFRLMLWWHRDILLLVCGADESALVYRDQAFVLKRIAARLTRRQALANVRVVEEMHTQTERNLPEGVVLDYGFLRLG
jgi:DNA polymerase-3 subunit delta'